MTLGERGGTTPDLDSGVALIETHKPVLSNAIRFDILDWLESHSTWHRNDLRVEVPADSKNAVGAVVSGLISSGTIVETGERRKSSDPASHGRKSNVFKLQQSAKSGGLGEPAGDMSVPSDGAVEGTGWVGARGSQVDLGASAASSSGPGRAVGGIAPGLSGEMSVGASPSCVPADPPRLFDVAPVRGDYRDAA